MRRLTLVCTLLTIVPTGAEAVTRSMFVTSVSGQGNLGAWPDAGSATGLAAGDAICRARATAAGLANPNDYVAWLSSSTDDAYCRIHGLAGKRADNCGQGSLPDSAGPWVRVDGLAFGAAITQLLFPDLEDFLPPRINENGNTVHGGAWTATDHYGVFESPACSGWTSTAGSGNEGLTDTTSRRWASSGSSQCSGNNHLYCLQTGAGDPLPPISNWGRLAFLTSAAGGGNLGSWPEAGAQTGLAAGDAICRSLATTAGLPNAGSFKAWLSDANIDARDRFTYDGPFMRLDRIRVATSLADLTDGFLHTPINFTDAGAYLINFGVWTGTASDGLAATNRCSDWTSSSSGDLGEDGAADAADASWTARATSSCDYTAGRLYCLQDLPLVFADGFESHDTSDWSSAVP